MFILRRVEFKNLRIGCCGLSRYDSISPVGTEVNFDEFKKEAIEILKNYGEQTYESSGDEYSIEYFEGKGTDQNFREDGKSFFKFILEGKEWKFYENGKKIFSIKNLAQLKKLWQK